MAFASARGARGQEFGGVVARFGLACCAQTRGWFDRNLRIFVDSRGAIARRIAAGFASRQPVGVIKHLITHAVDDGRGRLLRSDGVGLGFFFWQSLHRPVRAFAGLPLKLLGPQRKIAQ